MTNQKKKKHRQLPKLTRKGTQYIKLNKTCNELLNQIWFGLVSLFNGISIVVGYLMPKLFSLKNSSGTI